MQCERILSFFFKGNDAKEITENKSSMSKRYGNLGRHPNLIRYVALDADTTGKILSEDEGGAVVRDTPGKAIPGSFASTGAYFYCHGGASSMVPPPSVAAKTLVSWLVKTDGLGKGDVLPLQKVNLTACLGAGGKAKSKELSRSHLKTLCASLKSEAENLELTLPTGLAVCGYTALMGTFDPAYTFENLPPEKLSKTFGTKDDYAEPDKAPANPIRTYMYAPNSPDPRRTPTHERSDFETFDPIVDALMLEACNAVWSDVKAGTTRKARDFISAHKGIEKAASVKDLAEMKVFLAFLDAHKSQIEKAVREVATKSCNPSAHLVASAAQYVRRKAVMVYDGRDFRSASISEYPDNDVSVRSGRVV